MSKTTMRPAGRRQILVERRRAMQDDVQSRIRHGRTETANDVRDDLEHSDAASQGDLELALVQMRTETSRFSSSGIREASSAALSDARGNST